MQGRTGGIKINTAYLALGSNKWDRIAFLKKAVEFISAENKIIKTSSVYETKAYGKKDQADFLNAVIIITTEKNALELFYHIKDIEKKTGRTASERWGEREIDIDILFFNDIIIKNKIITIPHQGMAERDFVLVPLKEISPEFIHPLLKKTPEELIKKLTEKNIIRIFPERII
ncbi:MAG: 2-amino-4-hydroxy-6-hydroxymethyldihydropteridine diphosphokinase [Ignavibacteriales bacterium]|nr:MAG: 2-amino-4-hydroxy-6-hydroxymethyldihydropteridine diphosphokinase [Ignavibacteriales bacterium]